MLADLTFLCRQNALYVRILSNNKFTTLNTISQVKGEKYYLPLKPTPERSIGLKPSFKAGDSGFKE